MKTKFKYQIPFYLCDEKLQLRLDGLLKLLIDASMKNTDEVGGNIEGYNWILYRWYINSGEKINYKEEIEIETFSRKIDKFYAFRNFNIYKDGKKILEADSKWVLVSNDGLITRIMPKLVEKYGQAQGFEMPKVEIKKLEKYSHESRIKIRKSDIDVNGHVNNTIYLQYIWDVINLEEKSVKNLELVYKKELKFEDTPRILYTQEENVFECIIATDETIHTIAKIKFD